MTTIFYILINAFIKITYSFIATIYYFSNSGVGDSISYASSETIFSWEPLLTGDNTLFMMGIGGGINSLFEGYISPHRVISYLNIFISSILIYFIKTKRYLIIFSLSFFTFNIFTNIILKESIFNFLVLLFTLFTYFILSKKHFHILIYSFISLFLLFFMFKIRPSYTIGFAYLFSITVLVSFLEKQKIIISKFIFILTFISLFIIYQEYFLSEFIKIIERSINYHPDNNYAGANRHSWLIWRSVNHYYENFQWGIIFGFIGPLIEETIKRPILLPFFLEGIIIIFFFIWMIISSLNLIKKIPRNISHKYNLLIWIGLIPTFLILLLLHSPMGMPNSGSAIRYRANFELAATLIPVVVYISLLEKIKNENNLPDKKKSNN